MLFIVSDVQTDKGKVWLQDMCKYNISRPLYPRLSCLEHQLRLRPAIFPHTPLLIFLSTSTNQVLPI
jgi:hypothetical protein